MYWYIRQPCPRSKSYVLVHKTMAARRGPPGDVVINYELLRIRCGKTRCRCNTTNQDTWHGPYWYAFWNDPRTGRKRSFYLGKRFKPPHAEAHYVHHERRAPPDSARRERERQREEARGRAHAPPRGDAAQADRDAEFLGVDARASYEDARRVWKRKLAANHPDRFQGAERTRHEQIAKQINAAWERLRRRRGWT
jgi:hypothetical protein